MPKGTISPTFATNQSARRGFLCAQPCTANVGFLRKHGDRIVKEKPAPKRQFSTTLQLAQHVFSSRSKVVMHRPQTALHLYVGRRSSADRSTANATPNEAVDASGKRDLISPVYLQTSSWALLCAAGLVYLDSQKQHISKSRHRSK